MNISNKQHLLDQITADILTEHICPDLAKTAMNIVPGEGSANADIMFIGEAPGKNEDLTGRPFVGAAGKLLDKLLESIGLEREDVFITSIVKFRPPNNRDPRPDEKAAFLPFLLRQIDVIQPKLIVPLGRHALGQFMPQARIGQVHGQLQHWDGQPLLPLLHPAAALYNNSLRKTIEEDFLLIPKIMMQVSKKGKELHHHE